MENEKIPEMIPIEKSPGFNWGQVPLAVCVVIALILASWNAFSIMETNEQMAEEDSELSSEIEAGDSSLSNSIGVLDNNMSIQINTLDGRISDLQNKVNVLEGNITEIDSDINCMAAGIQDLQNQINNLKSRVTALEQACDFDNDGILDKYDTDDDNDGYPDTGDAFPNDATEWKDNDNDGIGDNADPDDDNDGYLDDADLFPYKDAKVKFTAISFTLEDSNDDVFFVVYIWGKATSPVFWDCPDGYEYTVDWSFVDDFPDNVLEWSILVSMYDEDIDGYNDPLDIEGKSASYYLYLEYNIVTGEWSGDDDDGYSSGFDDGRSGESDVLFSYNIETV